MTDNTQSEVVAYFYESKITSKHGSASWDRQLRDSHPETITNINYRNLQRLIPASESSKDLKTIGFQYELHGENTVTIHLIGAKNTIEVSAYTNTEIATDTGHDNEITVDTFPVDDLIDIQGGYPRL
jgi:hypothetical protein